MGASSLNMYRMYTMIIVLIPLNAPNSHSDLDFQNKCELFTTLAQNIWYFMSKLINMN